MNPSEKDLDRLQERIGYRFQDKGLLSMALTHSSFANEARIGRLRSNERLEFLGDAVLELISSAFLYQRFPHMTEGELTKKRASLVCEPTLAMCARAFDLPEYLILGKGEEQTGGRFRDSIISDTCEALLGAVFLDGGFENARSFVMRFILKDIEHLQLFVDSKTILQEIAQEKGQSCEYRLVDQSGPDHDKSFIAEVYLDHCLLGTGQGHTKKNAEQAAAYEAVRQLRGTKSYSS